MFIYFCCVSLNCSISVSNSNKKKNNGQEFEWIDPVYNLTVKQINMYGERINTVVARARETVYEESVNKLKVARVDMSGKLTGINCSRRSAQFFKHKLLSAFISRY